MKLTIYIKRLIWYIPVILFVILRLPSLFEPLWYEDEGITSSIAFSLNKGKTLYIDVWDHKPPGLYYIYSFIFKIFNNNLFAIKFISLILGILALYLLYKIIKSFLSNEVLIFLCLILFSIIWGSPILEGNIADAEVFFVPLGLVAIYLLIRPTTKVLPFLYSGLIFYFTTIIKPLALFDAIPIIIALLVARKFNFKQFLFILYGFTIPWIITCLYYLKTGIFNEFFQALISSNIDYINKKSFSILSLSPVETKMVFIIVFTLILSLIYIKKKFDFTLYLLILWTSWDIFSIFLSGRNYAHYELQLIPSILLLIFYLLSKVSYKEILSLSNYKYLLSASLLFISFIWITYAFTTFNYIGGEKTVVNNYYQSFSKYMLGKYTSTQYYSSFLIDTQISTEPYPLTQNDIIKISSIIDRNSTSDQCIFLWTNLPQLYILSQRLSCSKYLVDYHIVALSSRKSYIINTLKINVPKLILTSNNGYIFPYINNYVEKNYILLDKVQYISIYKHK